MHAAYYVDLQNTSRSITAVFTEHVTHAGNPRLLKYTDTEDRWRFKDTRVRSQGNWLPVVGCLPTKVALQCF